LFRWFLVFSSYMIPEEDCISAKVGNKVDSNCVPSYKYYSWCVSCICNQLHFDGTDASRSSTLLPLFQIFNHFDFSIA
jgi:hypothetical protein